jgi:D-arabinose 1-dehydrogenase-like Zn-dependent alcohol dehydrogenase
LFPAEYFSAQVSLDCRASQSIASKESLLIKQRQRSAHQTEQGEGAKDIYKREQVSLIQQRAVNSPNRKVVARGNLIMAPVPDDQIQLSAVPLVFSGRSIYGSLTGAAIETEDTIAFSVLENIRPMIETVPLEQAADTHARLMQGEARFRMLLVTKDGIAQRSPVN